MSASALARIPLALPGICADALFPRVCHACNAPLMPRGAIACPACRDALVPVDEWDDTYRRVLSSLREEGTIAEFVSAWYFEREGPVRALMHRLKYGGCTSIGIEFGRMLGERIRESGLAESDLIIPLPLHPSRMRERGYNQSDFIARGVSAVTGRPVGRRLVRRTRFTPSQTPFGQLARRDNVRDAFALRPRALRALEGRTVILVDDVVTTGSTMRSCAGVLHRAGVRSVIACSAAIAR